MNGLLLSAGDLWDQIHYRYRDKGGVYKLHCLVEVGGEKVEETSRLLGVDGEGVLYIGKAMSFTDRVVNLRKALLPNVKSSDHICGRRYWNPRFEGLRDRFPFERLCVTLKESDNPEELEREELDIYCRTFGEPPPLNRMD